LGERELGAHLTMWPGPRASCMPNFVLIYPTVWPQYTNVTDMTDSTDIDRTDRTDRQRSDSMGRTVLETVAQKIIPIASA